jgi:signal peptidase I
MKSMCMETPRKRRPVLALLLSLITPGLGQLYNGQIKRAGFVYLAGVLLTVVFFSGFYTKFHFLILFLVLGVCYFLFAMADALYQAIKIKVVALKPFNRCPLYVVIILAHFFLIGFCIHAGLFPVKLYRIPSASMAPGLLPGDYFFIDKKYYTIRKPQRGDIVVFQLPAEPSRDYIKRVVGLPGETVEIARQKLIINEQYLKEPYLKRSGSTGSYIGLLSKINFGPVAVPNDRLFLLGDNRKGSSDSRNFGSVDISALKGKALYIVWARDNSRVGKEIN